MTIALSEPIPFLARSHAFVSRLRWIAVTTLFLGCALARGQTQFCPYKVIVKTSDGFAVAKTKVVMLGDHRSSLVEITTDVQGTALICGAPVTTVDFVIGSDICGSVIVRNIRPAWPKPREIFVTYDKQMCNHFFPADNVQVWLHIQDSQGNPLSGARFEGKRNWMSMSGESDVLGRIFLVFQRNEIFNGIIVKGAFRSPATLFKVEDDTERTIRLHEQ